LQVEHPVTEAITGIDLVKLQLRIAAGEALTFSQDAVATRGHAIECRIYAEDPDNNFFPSPGKITSWRAPTGPGIRLDEGVYSGWTVPADYDPLLAKLIAWGSDRREAIARLRRALEEFDLGGIKTNIGLFSAILDDKDFASGNIHTCWLDERIPELLRVGRNGRVPARQHSLSAEDAAAVAAGLWFMKQNNAQAAPEAQPVSAWKLRARRDQISSGLDTNEA
jgi:acetyl-CoA carboxylase biotin carboxylase subunit